MNNRYYLKIFSLSWVALFNLIGCTHIQTTEAWKGYSLTWLGTAGWKVSYRDETVLIDPYFSRTPIKDKNGKEVYNRIWESDTIAIESSLKLARISDVQAILVSHSHFDHFGDVPYLVKRFPDAIVYGSSTTCNLLASFSPVSKCVDSSNKRAIELSGLTIRAIPTLHSFAGPDHKIPFAGIIETRPTQPLKVSDYVEGGSMIFYLQADGMDLLFQGSANFIEKELDGLHPKTAILAPILYKNVDRYQKRLLDKIQPKRIFLNHFDNFYLPYSKEMNPLDEKELSQFIAELKELNPSIELIVPQFFKEIIIKD